MKILGSCLFALLIVMAFFAPGSWADEMDAINFFYGGLADIVEQNRSNPDECVAKAQAFIRANAPSLNEAAERAKQAVPREPTADEVARMMNEPPPMVSGGRMGAIERFSLVFGIFAQKHPEQAAKITQVVSEFQKT